MVYEFVLGFFLFLLYKRTDRYVIWSRAHNNYIKPSKWHTKNANYGLKNEKKQPTRVH